ncbi:hypothetical protein LguiA_023806 [Lonicera macranthoides]
MDNKNHNNTPRRNPRKPNHGGGREDCWSEGSTETLIEAWGDRYLRLNRGNLRQKDWIEVSDAVNSRRSSLKSPRTDVQCKNRIDTLKKKYKLHKSKPSPSPSNWPFYFRLDHLIGPNAVTPPNNKKQHKPTAVNFNIKPINPNPNPKPNPSAAVVYSAGSSSMSKQQLNSSESSLREVDDDDDDDDVLFGGSHDAGGMRKNRVEFSEEEEAYKELARAVLRFGEIYERIENSKQKQMMELEKQRMEFTKDLEFQRMNMFMDAQLQLEKMNRPTKGAPGAGKKS